MRHANVNLYSCTCFLLGTHCMTGLRKEEKNPNAEAQQAKGFPGPEPAAAKAFCRPFQDCCLHSTLFVLKAVPHAGYCQGNTNKARLSVNGD